MATLVELKEAEVDSITKILLAEHGADMDYEIENSNQIGIRIEQLERKLGIGVLFLCIALMGCEPPAEPQSPVEAMDANVSAYCPCERCCGKYSDGITANGYKIQPGDKFCAADSRFPFGTLMNIPGYGKVPVLDRGGVIKGDKLDVYFSTHQEALQWGRQHLQVKIERKKQ